MQASRRLRHAALAVALVGGLGAVTAFGVAPIADSAVPAPVTITEPLSVRLAGSDLADSFLQSELVRRGDNLGHVLARLGANDPEILRFAQNDPLARKALTLRPGRTVRAEVDPLGRVLKLAYRGTAVDEAGKMIESSTRLVVRRTADGLVATEEAVPTERVVEMRAIEVRSTLFQATDSAGIPESVAVQIAEIFGGDFDLQRAG